jgi:tagatose 1,6-diphosphate aldolase GatY/KbaY
MIGRDQKSCAEHRIRLHDSESVPVEARFSELLADADARDGAVGAFTCYNLETALGVLLAAEERRQGVLLLVSRQSFSAPLGESLFAALVGAAAASPVLACVQLDHVSELAPIERAFELGAGAVMADGSKLPLAENIELVRAAARGGEVEAELGGIAGDEDVAVAAAAEGRTDPAEATRFVQEAKPACLAVSIGNVHGRYREPPELDWPRLAQIRKRVDVPLSLHGASGLSNEDLRRAVSLGVRKVNVNTELREAYLAVTAARAGEVVSGARVLELNTAQIEAVAAVVREKLDVLG